MQSAGTHEVVQIRGAAKAHFWPKAGAWPNWSKTEALPGIILAQGGRLAELVENGGAARVHFWPEAGAWPKWSKTKALPGFILGRSWRLAEVVKNRGAARAFLRQTKCTPFGLRNILFPSPFDLLFFLTLPIPHHPISTYISLKK